MAEKPEVVQDVSTPISLRESAPQPSTLSQPNRSYQAIYVVVTAVVFLIVGLLLATFLNNDEGIDQEELRDTVSEIVGTQIAAAGPVAGDVNQGDVQAMIDAAVSTQVQALIPTNTPIPPTPTIIPNPIVYDDDAYLGPEDAPVVIVEFSDFQCGYCGRFYEDTLTKIVEKYPDQVRFVYRDFPIFGEDSARAAMATECAEEQGKFWEMHNKLFDIHNAGEQVTLDAPTLVSYAGDLELDTTAFEQCLSSEKYIDEILNDYEAARTYGFGGTPGFVINGVVYAMGAQPFEVFDGIIQEELSKLQTGG